MRMASRMPVFPVLFLPTRIRAFSTLGISRSRMDLKFWMWSEMICMVPPL